VLDQAVRDRNLLRPADKAAAVEDALPFVRAVRNGIQKREYFDMAMDALRVEEPALRRELWQSVKANAPAGQDVRQKIVRAAGAQPTVAEQRLLELLVQDAELRRTILPRMESRDYEELPTASIFRALIALEAEGADVDFTTLTAKTEDDPLAADFVPLLLMGEPERAEGEAVDDTLATAESCLNALHLMMVDRRINELSVEISTAERMGDTERRDRLALEHLEWARRRNALGNLRP
jgi:DNA primase